ncbi:glycosyltransferase family 4 protein [uncultured Friedmanniella sp.]|uniref:glycosyltransferase family 4 protein n=1 Tax=uncultured Friedmanniella sp. TaxID=335381 RepID=UPI0035C96415
MTSPVSTRGPVLVVHPSPDLYGADLQMLQTVVALVEQGRRVVVALPADGPLVARIRAVGAEVRFVAFPVLSKGQANAKGLPLLAVRAVATLARGTQLLRELQPEVLLVNTVTLPWWLLVGRLGRVPTVGYLHEAETDSRRIVRRALVLPLRLTHAVLVISRAALAAMTDVEPALAERARLVYNGVPGPPTEPGPPPRGTPYRFVVVGRLSPRKAPDVALEAVALVRAHGHEVELEVAGTTFEGYEWYEDQLRARAAEPDLAGAVTFSGYCSPIWPALERNHHVLAPSLREPFGNAVVEAQLAGRPVVAAASLGHLESVTDGETGLLVPAGDAAAMAAAMERLVADPELARRLADRARREAERRFSVARYRREIVEVVDAVAEGRQAVGYRPAPPQTTSSPSL